MLSASIIAVVAIMVNPSSARRTSGLFRRAPACDLTLGNPVYADCQNALTQIPSSTVPQSFGNGLGRFTDDNSAGFWLWSSGKHSHWDTRLQCLAADCLG